MGSGNKSDIYVLIQLTELVNLEQLKTLACFTV